jgi:hypothetical protein
VLGGGPDANQQLTTQIGVILLVLLAAIGATIPFLSQLIAEHLFLGFLLLGPVVAKMGSTGYRFVRYYTHDPAYRKKGPPHLSMRLIAPIVVLSTVVVFVSGIVLMFEGPNHRDPSLTIHKLSFIVWLVFMGLHVLGHLLELPGSLRGARETRNALPGLSSAPRGRWVTIAGSMAAGLVVALVLIPSFGSWTAGGVFRHHRTHEASAVSSGSHTAVRVTSRIRLPATRG